MGCTCSGQDISADKQNEMKEGENSSNMQEDNNNNGEKSNGINMNETNNNNNENIINDANQLRGAPPVVYEKNEVKKIIY